MLYCTTFSTFLWIASQFLYTGRLNFKIIGKISPNSKRTSGPMRVKPGIVTYGLYCAELQIELPGSNPSQGHFDVFLAKILIGSSVTVF